MAHTRQPTPHPTPPPDDVAQSAAPTKPLVTVNFEREVDVTTGKGETRRFVKMYFEARDSGLLAALPDELWKTLCVLATYLDENGLCFPSQDQLAKDLGIGRQAANKRIQRLREFRFNDKPIIEIARSTVPQDIGGVRRDKNLYRLYPIAGFHFGAAHQAPDTKDMVQMSPQRDIWKNQGLESRCRVDQTSGGRDTNKNNDNDLNVNVGQNPPERKPRRETPAVHDPRVTAPVSYAALQKRYGLDEHQCGEVAYLLELQTRFLGSAAQNQRNYVHRAATVVEHGLTGRFAAALRDFDEQCKRNPPKRGRPQLFHAIWLDQQTAYLNLRQNSAAEIVNAATAQLTARYASPPEPPADDDQLDPQERRRRQYVQQIEAKGYVLPPHIRRASVRDIALWLDQHPDPTSRPDHSA